MGFADAHCLPASLSVVSARSPPLADVTPCEGQPARDGEGQNTCLPARSFYSAMPRRRFADASSLGHFQLGSYRYRSLIEGLYTLKKPYSSPI